jgi:HD-GYP domain-containing protein (c-di-GMP phosphodiesterase class II)
MNQNAAEEKGSSLAEVLACLGLASDLATGVPMEHSLRRVLLATWLGEELGLSAEQLSTTFYVALLGSLGCVVNVAAVASYVRDEIRLRGEMFTIDVSNELRVVALSASHVAGSAPWSRLGHLMRLPFHAMAVSKDVAVHVGSMLDLEPELTQTLGQCDEHWDGKGTVLGLKGEEISLPARLFLIAQDVEVFDRAGGPEAAVTVVSERSGRYYDPAIAAKFCALAPSILERLHTVPAWETVLESEPAPRRMLAAGQLDNVLGKVGDVVDLRSSYTVGHSQRVAGLAEGAARDLGLSAAESTVVRRAGFIHDLGRMGVPVATWERKGSLTPAQWLQIKDHASLTELMVSRSELLSPLGTIAGAHHERLDGSGYRGFSAALLPSSSRLLAAADAYATKLEHRPHRPAMTDSEAAEYVQREAASGLFDPNVVDALLSASGRKPGASATTVGALTARETAVLRLLVQGYSNREIGGRLYLSPKTVGLHIESIYAKAGVSTRVGATLYAVQHGVTHDIAPFSAK